MSAINLKVKQNGQYKDVTVCVYGNWTDIGLCDEVESEAIADALRSAADDLHPIDETETAAYAEGRKDEREEWLPVLEALKTLRSRLLECSEHGSISARDAYDSFYQEVVDDAIKAVTGEQA